MSSKIKIVIGATMLMASQTVAATQFSNEFEAALPLCEQLTDPASIPKAPGLDINSYLTKIKNELRAQSRFFGSEEGLDFLRNRIKASLDSGTKQCAQWLLEFAESPQPNNSLVPTPGTTRHVS